MNAIIDFQLAINQAQEICATLRQARKVIKKEMWRPITSDQEEDIAIMIDSIAAAYYAVREAADYMNEVVSYLEEYEEYMIKE